MGDALSGLFGEPRPEDVQRAKELGALLNPKPERRFIAIDPAYKLDPDGRLAHRPGGTESDEVDAQSSIEVDGHRFYGVYRGRWLKDMSQAELIALVLHLTEKLKNERNEAQTMVHRLQEELEEKESDDGS